MSDVIRLGVVGCGRVFERFHLRALSRVADWQLVGLCDRDEGRRGWARAACPRIPIFESLSALVADVASSAVLVTTPPVSHRSVVVEALDLGVHALVEKPMALSPDDAAAMVEASRRNDRRLAVGFNRRFLGPYRMVKKRLSSTSPGEIRSIRHEFGVDARWDPVDGFHGDVARGGGLLDDVASHQIDLLPWITGRSIEGVRADSDRGEEGIDYEIRLDGPVIARCTARRSVVFRESLEIAFPDRTWLTHLGGVVETRRAPGRAIRRYCALRNVVHLAVRRLSGRPGATLDAFTRQLVAFAAAVRNPGAPAAGADGASALRTVQTIASLRESLKCDREWRSVNQVT